MEGQAVEGIEEVGWNAKIPCRNRTGSWKQKNADFILIILYENHRAAAGNLFPLVETLSARSMEG